MGVYHAISSYNRKTLKEEKSSSIDRLGWLGFNKENISQIISLGGFSEEDFDFIVKTEVLAYESADFDGDPEDFDEEEYKALLEEHKAKYALLVQWASTFHEPVKVLDFLNRFKQKFDMVASLAYDNVDEEAGNLQELEEIISFVKEAIENDCLIQCNLC